MRYTAFAAGGSMFAGRGASLLQPAVASGVAAAWLLLVVPCRAANAPATPKSRPMERFKPVTGVLPADPVDCSVSWELSVLLPEVKKTIGHSQLSKRAYRKASHSIATRKTYAADADVRHVCQECAVVNGDSLTAATCKVH